MVLDALQAASDSTPSSVEVQAEDQPADTTAADSQSSDSTAPTFEPAAVVSKASYRNAKTQVMPKLKSKCELLRAWQIK